MKPLKPQRPMGCVHCTRDATYVPAFLCDAYALLRHSAEGAAEPDETQVSQLDRGVYEGVCSGHGCASSGAIPDAGNGCSGHAGTFRRPPC